MPDFSFEDSCGKLVAGIDEAGRGPWAGPVVAGAVVFLDKNIDTRLIEGLDDSKKLTAKKREILYDLMFDEEQKGRLCIGIGEASCREIDELNILQATFLAMRRAYDALTVKPKLALIDGNRNPKNFPCQTQTIIKGDAKSFSIAAASILAKVTRDRYCLEMDEKYPEYQFAKHKGYGTKLHYEMIAEYGICPEHRRTFLKKILGE